MSEVESRPLEDSTFVDCLVEEFDDSRFIGMPALFLAGALGEHSFQDLNLFREAVSLQNRAVSPNAISA